MHQIIRTNIHRTHENVCETFACPRRAFLARSLALGGLAATSHGPLATGGPPTGTFAWLVLEAETGRELAQKKADTPLAPASCLKLLTAVFALAVLGPEHRFRTRLLVTGALRDDALAGDLVLRGEGDPLLDLDHLLALALALKRAGVRRILGRFFVDESAFPVVPRLSSEEPEWAPWNAGVGPLGVAFDRVSLGESEGGPFSIPPLVARLQRVPVSRTGAEGIRAVRSADGTLEAWLLADDRPLPEALPVEDPGLHAARLFARFAAGCGIVLPEPQSGAPSAPAREIAVHTGLPLRDGVRAMLHHSNNQVAERLGLAAAAALLGQAPRGRRHSAAVMAEYLAQRIADFPARGLNVADHCGLSRDNRLTARALAAVLREGLRRFELPALLPLAGWSGTLARRFRAPDRALGLAAKTGSLDYASALAGYLVVPGRALRIVAMLADDAAARAAFRSRQRAGESDRRAAQLWLRLARAREEETIARLLAGS